MFKVKIDNADPADLYEQVAAEIRRAIADGKPSQETGSLRPRTSQPFST